MPRCRQQEHSLKTLSGISSRLIRGKYSLRLKYINIYIHIFHYMTISKERNTRTRHVWFSYISFHCLFPNHALLLKTWWHTHSLIWHRRARAQTASARLLRALLPQWQSHHAKRASSPGMLSPVSFLISLVSLFSHSLLFFFLLPHLFSVTPTSLQAYIALHPAICVIIHKWARVHVYAQGIHARHEREGDGGVGASKLHTYRAQMLHVQREGPRTLMIRASAAHTHARSIHIT